MLDNVAIASTNFEYIDQSNVSISGTNRDIFVINKIVGYLR